MQGDATVLVDVRSVTEYDSFHLHNAVNIPVADLRTRYVELDPSKETILSVEVARDQAWVQAF
jgi:rhodanese-related sulfurtransferase